jgi:hypothetical protein
VSHTHTECPCQKGWPKGPAIPCQKGLASSCFNPCQKDAWPKGHPIPCQKGFASSWFIPATIPCQKGPTSVAQTCRPLPKGSCQTLYSVQVHSPCQKGWVVF